MKLITFIFIITFSLLIQPYFFSNCFAHNDKHSLKKFVLKGKIENIPARGSMLMGTIIENPGLIEIDSQRVEINEGHFIFTGLVSDTTPVILYFETEKGGLGLQTNIMFIEPGILHIEMDYNNMRNSNFHIDGSSSNNHFLKIFGPEFENRKLLEDRITDSMQQLDDMYTGDTLRMEFSKMRNRLKDVSINFQRNMFNLSKNYKSSILPLYLFYENYDGQNEQINKSCVQQISATLTFFVKNTSFGVK